MMCLLVLLFFMIIISFFREMDRENTSYMYVCSECGKEFQTKSTLSQHERRHRSLAPYVCCGKTFFSTANITRHRCNAHGETKSHMCPICGKGFAIKADLTRHRRKEEKTDFVSCNVCNYKAPSKTYMRDHMNKHQPGNNFQCQVCLKSYKYRSGLARHKANHHN
jgi:KRAB domain-containing zinc finger protein